MDLFLVFSNVTTSDGYEWELYQVDESLEKAKEAIDFAIENYDWARVDEFAVIKARLGDPILGIADEYDLLNEEENE